MLQLPTHSTSVSDNSGSILSPATWFIRLKRDVALCGGLISAAGTLLALFLLAWIFWSLLIDRLELRVEEALVARHEIALQNTSVLSDEEREVVRRFRQSLPLRDEGAFAWIDNDGVAFSSSVSGLECEDDFFDGWVDGKQSALNGPVPLVPHEDIDPTVHDRFRFLAQTREQGCLIFGRSLYEVDALQQSARRLLMWLVPLCLLPALVISLQQSWKLRQRLRAFGRVMKAVSSGDLDARVPVHSDDDIDQLAMTANRSFDRLQESVGTLQQLTSVMAHDLRAPLSRVAVPLDEAIRANHAGRPDVDSLDEVKEGLADVRAVFDALLRISQIESGRRRARFSDIDLFDVIEGLYEIYEPVANEAGRTLELEVTGSGSSVIAGDSDLLRQAVVNLIENAMRYAPKGSHIRVAALRDAYYPAIVVSDDGPGVPEAERPRVLRRLYRYSGSTNGQNGHGLGLSLVKAVVDLHDGSLTLEDASPGLLVRLQFPVASDS